MGLARANQSSSSKHGRIAVFLAEEAPCRLDLELCDQLFKEGAAGQGGGACGRAGLERGHHGSVRGERCQGR